MICWNKLMFLGCLGNCRLQSWSLLPFCVFQRQPPSSARYHPPPLVYIRCRWANSPLKCHLATSPRRPLMSSSTPPITTLIWSQVTISPAREPLGCLLHWRYILMYRKDPITGFFGTWIGFGLETTHLWESQLETLVSFWGIRRQSKTSTDHHLINFLKAIKGTWNVKSVYVSLL